MLQLFFSELKWMEKTGTKITIFEWDTKVHREYDFKEFDGNVQGRGGTDPTEFLETVSERKFDCVITFTDLYFSPIKKDYNMPMLWVCDRGSYSWYNEDDDDFIANTTISIVVRNS
jgi:predicted metal-dependent peptidase